MTELVTRVQILEIHAADATRAWVRVEIEATGGVLGDELTTRELYVGDAVELRVKYKEHRE